MNNRYWPYVVLLTALLLSGCWGFRFPLGDTPEEYTNNKKILSTLLGSPINEVTDKIGRPAFTAYKDNKTYYIYEWWSDESCIVMLGIVPMPIPYTDEGTEVHCMLLEFDQDRRLSSYKVDTESCHNYSSPVNCAEVFKMGAFAARQPR